MSRKQNSYLADLLKDDPTNDAISPAPVVERARASTLLHRESALARVQSGEVRQVTQLLLDPARVRVWPGNARLYDQLSEASCADLIDSLIAEGGQKVPAVVRRISNDPHYDYEVIAGTRRHWSISWLRTHSYPDMQFVAQVVTLDDEAAFRLADLENRARRDVSDVARARNYAAALIQHYGGKQKRMAERLRVSEGWLSKMLQVARIPDEVLAAFPSWDVVLLKPAYTLARALDEHHAAERITQAARTLANEQAAARRQDELPIPAAEVLRRLLAAGSAPDEVPSASVATYNSQLGRPALTIQSINRQGVTVRLHAASGADNEELVATLRQALADLDASGRRVRQ
ncbi:ParB/RepB/Spo0J family partition protein [Asaia bogorensis]|uniref:ParB/RepB/Spo0J family partition protein n=1 Tax=Asaia bogorensis TaxID=91915 RepID=UPI000EFBF00A|nr:ParB/RepB/Spo0J family partition protein [Asaia bogorensis]